MRNRKGKRDQLEEKVKRCEVRKERASGRVRCGAKRAKSKEDKEDNENQES